VKKIYFLDFEASSLDAGSYPIEIGWVGENGQGESYLIEPHWSWSGWSAASEQVHHISQETLRTQGTSVEIVARRTLAVLSNSIIISDQPPFEYVWLEMLLNVIDAPPLPIIHIDSLIGHEIGRMQSANTAAPDDRDWHRQARSLADEGQICAMGAFEGAKLRPTQHRALADAEDLWRGWNAVRQAIDRRIKKDLKAKSGSQMNCYPTAAIGPYSRHNDTNGITSRQTERGDIGDQRKNLIDVECSIHIKRSRR
jgi:hypothetical protein